jgi:hypothetical protein
VATDFPDSGQLDLFEHSRSVVLANDVIDALLARDAALATERFNSLCIEEPGHRAREALQTLCRALGEWPRPSANPAAIAEAVRWLDAHAHPAALSALGDKAADFMRPFWRELASAAGPHAYDPAFPQTYRASLYLRCGDALAAATAAQAIPNFDGNYDALHWIAVARYRAEGFDACRTPLLRLALLAPKRLPALLAEIDEPLLNRHWRAFQSDCHWLDSEDDTAGSWYPAWHLVEHPGMEIEIGELATLPATKAAHTFVEIGRLLGLEKSGYSAALVSARSRLRELSPEVFALYMARRDVRHR